MLFVLFLSLSAGFSAIAVDFGGAIITPQMHPDDGLLVMEQNLALLNRTVAEARNQHKTEDLLLAFPEDCLTGPIFSSRQSIAPYLQALPQVGSVPARNDSLIVYVLSEIAKENQVFLVVGLPEKGADSKQFNTVVAFAPMGTLVGRARKAHLYFEPQFDAGPPEQPERLFRTPFGTVGMCVCFDVLFSNVLFGDLVRADVIVSSSWWVNVNPIASGIAMHAGIASLVKKVVVAPSSGYNWANSGSLVVQGNISNSVFNPGWSSRTQWAILTSMTTQKGMRGAGAGKPSRKDARDLQVLTFDAAVGDFEKSIGDHVCNASFRFLSVSEEEQYGLVSFSGPYRPQPNQPALFWLDLCALVKCSSSVSCESIYYATPNISSTSVFATLSISSDRDGEVPIDWTIDGKGNVMLGDYALPSTVSSMAKWKMTSRN